jgi:hypothetical protein
MKVEAFSNDMGVGENGVRVRIIQKYSFTHLRTKLHGRSL